MPHSFLARKPANCTYQVWQCTTLASRLSFAIARLRYMASSAPPKRGSVFCLASGHAGYPFTRRFGSVTSCSPKQRTSTGTRRDSSRPRYSTCTPAPPYTCGGYSLVKSATLLMSGIGLLLSGLCQLHLSRQVGLDPLSPRPQVDLGQFSCHRGLDPVLLVGQLAVSAKLEAHG